MGLCKCEWIVYAYHNLFGDGIFIAADILTNGGADHIATIQIPYGFASQSLAFFRPLTRADSRMSKRASQKWLMRRPQYLDAIRLCESQR
jgi:hypothetical protein